MRCSGILDLQDSPCNGQRAKRYAAKPRVEQAPAPQFLVRENNSDCVCLCKEVTAHG